MTIGQTINIAFKRLRGKWMKYAVAYLILSLPMFIGIVLSSVFDVVIATRYGYASDDIVLYYYLYTMGQTAENIDYSVIMQAIKPVMMYESIVTLCTVINSLCFALPLASYFLGAAENNNVTFKDSFALLGKSIPLTLLMALKIFLWSLLFIVPGIIKSFAYSQAYYVKAENSGMSANECIKRSDEMMKGKKAKYFLLMLIVGLCTGVITYVASFLMTILSLAYSVMLGTLAYVIIDIAVTLVVSVVAEIIVGMITTMVCAVFYVDVKRSHLDTIEQKLRASHEMGGDSGSVFGGSGDVYTSGSSTNVTHADPFDNDNNGNSNN